MVFQSSIASFDAGIVFFQWLALWYYGLWLTQYVACWLFMNRVQVLGWLLAWSICFVCHRSRTITFHDWMFMKLVVANVFSIISTSYSGIFVLEGF